MPKFFEKFFPQSNESNNEREEKKEKFVPKKKKRGTGVGLLIKLIFKNYN